MQASLDLAKSGFKVYLVENKPAIGGVMLQLDKTFPTNDCAMCTMSPRLVDVASEMNIELLTFSCLKGLTGEPGNFRAAIYREPRYVIEERCTGCGDCIQVCPVKLKNKFNMGLGKQKAIDFYSPQCIPNVVAINRERCLKLTKDKCGLCQKTCKREAIDYNQKEEEIILEVGAVIASPGFELFDPTVQSEYGYGRYPNVVTSLEFERILSPSGPYQGSILRPSDGKAPGSIAWIQCFGSRELKRNYCSSVCCMYATKESIITKDHHPEIDCSIFFIDLRAFGKGFDAYYERAQKIGTKYIRARPSSIKEVPGTKNLKIQYQSGTGEIVNEEFNLIVLSAGVQPSRYTRDLAERLNLKLNAHGFCQTSKFSPLSTNKEGIYAAGPFTEPKDIPETVMQASGAAAKAMILLKEERGKLIRPKEHPPETDVTGQEPRIGVFVCHCGTNIASVVDVPDVLEYVRNLPNVVYADNNLFACSTDAQEGIKEAIREYRLNRVVVASCTPRTHELLFRETIREAGLNPYLFEMANIRDQCSWVHAANHAAATNKAKDLIRMAVGRAALLEGLYTIPMDITKRALIIGGGASGMVASLSLANQGFEVELIERETELGGNLRQIHYTLEDADPQEYLKQLVEQTQNHKLIKVHLKSEVKELSGHVGHFKTAISNQGSGIREIEHGVVIVATGGMESEPTEYLYGQEERIITQRQLEERLAQGSGIRGQGSVVMIQCVGSRDEERPYCSRICCSEAIKNALKIKELSPETKVYILYRDIRTYGFREEYYRAAREAGVIFIRHDKEAKPVVTNDDGKLKVQIKDPILGMDLALNPDMVVLSAAIISHPENEKLAPLLKVTLNAERFFLEAHMKLRPVDFASDGMFLCGLAHSPKLLEESIAQAQAAAARAATILSKKQLEIGGVVSQVDEDKCVACLTCLRMCPYDVPIIGEKGVAEIEAAKCQGCGICASECPAKAIQLMHYKDAQVTAKLDAMFEVGVGV